MASTSVPSPKTALVARVGSNASNPKPKKTVSFPSRASKLLGFQCANKKQSAFVKVQSQLNEVIAKASSNSAPVLETSLKDAPLEEKVTSVANNIPDESTISSFMAHVSDLVKLVDSRDISELQLKQLDIEVVIRKKEALQPPPSPPAPPVIAMQTPAYPYAVVPSPPPPPAPVPASAPPSPAPSTAPALPSPAKSGSSSHPPLKCPMAGTFYRSPAPGEAAFVKVGDKVQKGQVICIIEAMKLMNEIEADQSGTIAEILVENGQQVSVDMPLFVIVH